MRPRVFPAEDLADSAAALRQLAGFNEAAGIPRGRRLAVFQEVRPHRRFNEAAGIPRGRRGVDRSTISIDVLLQ